ncbi:MAG: transcription termination factor Rho [Gemmatimonadetes bacterium]|nr:transcription termination factor Rho [Gemmatimonadota bacterium]
MTERRRPYRRRRTTGKRPEGDASQDNPYRDPDTPSGESESPGGGAAAAMEDGGGHEGGGGGASDAPSAPSEGAASGGDMTRSEGGPPAQGQGGPQQGERPWQQGGGRRNGRRGRRGRFRDRPFNNNHGDAPGNAQGGGFNNNQAQQQQQPVVADGETTGWFDPSRDGGFIRRAGSSYLAEPGDPWVAPWQVRQLGLRKSDKVQATTGRDFRGRTVLVDVQLINDADPALSIKRADFQSLTASYPDRKLILETGRPAKGGPELTRRAIDLVAPIGYGQRALIVAPARAGKTMLMHAVTEGISINHPEAVLLILLVDERPEEVSEAISWGVGEVIASSFDQPAKRHVEVTEMVLERARRLVELGRDVIIVLDSLTRMARAHNTAERGTGRTMSGGLDATAMAKPKAFFGSARAVAPANGGGSLTIIATALVETGSRMDDVIFEEFKGTGNCEIKLDRSLAEKRIFPAIDVATSGTRREDKLFRPDQLEHVHMLRRGLGQMPPQAAMEWLIKRIANTTNNDALLDGL